MARTKRIVTKKLDTGQCTFVKYDFVLCNNSVVTACCYGQLIKLLICFVREIGSVVGSTRISGACRANLYFSSHVSAARARTGDLSVCAGINRILLWNVRREDADISLRYIRLRSA